MLDKIIFHENITEEFERELKKFAFFSILINNEKYFNNAMFVEFQENNKLKIGIVLYRRPNNTLEILEAFGKYPKQRILSLLLIDIAKKLNYNNIIVKADDKRMGNYLLKNGWKLKENITYELKVERKL